MAEQTLADYFIDYLSEEGFRPKIDGDGDITFKYEGGTYVLQVSEEDEQYVLLFRPFILIDTDDERKKAQVAIEKINGTIKVANLRIVQYADGGSGVWSTVELFLADVRTDFPTVFARCISAIGYAVERFDAEVNEKLS